MLKTYVKRKRKLLSVYKTQKPKNQLDAIQAFVSVTRDYCTWFDSSKPKCKKQLTLQMERYLARIYVASLDLPEVKMKYYEWKMGYRVQEDEYDFDVCLTGKIRYIQNLPFETYREVFDTNINATYEDPIAHSLWSDLVETYSVLRQGLWFFDHGNEKGALWSWLTNIEWWTGNIISALRAINKLKRFDNNYKLKLTVIK